MRAIRQHEFGPAETLRHEEVPDPLPAEGQVRIAVRAAGVHLVDTTIRSGRKDSPFPVPQLPMTPGREVAGVVDKVGEGVDSGWIGKRVVAHLGWASGGYAEYAVTEVAALHELPADGIGDAEAVAMVGTGRTAMGVFELAEVTPDDVVLVTSAAGGMGTLLIQATRNRGATAIGVAGGPLKAARVAEVGADFVADYNDADWAERLRGELGDRAVTVVIDGVGGTAGRAAFELLGPGGRHILIGWSSGEPTPIATQDIVRRGLTVTSALGARMIALPGGLHGLASRALAEANAGTLHPAVQRFPLKAAAEAHHALETRQTMGKVVLIP